MSIRSNIRIIVFIILCGCLGLTAANVTAAEAASNTNTASDTARLKQVEDLKERLATKVAELTQTKKAAVYGNVTAISLTTVSVETETKEVKIELTDDINVYQQVKGKRTRLTTDDIEKGDLITVFGDYDPSLDLLKGKVIIIGSAQPVRIFGTITDVDGKNYTISVKGTDNRMYTVDYERSTQSHSWEKEGTAAKIGFSKLIAGDTVTVLGTAEPKSDNRLSAIRFLDLGPLGGATSVSNGTAASGSAGTEPTAKSAR